MPAFSQESFKNIKKAELHLHLGGSYPLSFLETIATASEMKQMKDDLSKFQSKVNYHEGFGIFPKIAKLVDTEEKVYHGVLALCKESAKDGVSHLEIRTGLRDMQHGKEGYLKAILNAFSTFQQDGFKATLVLSVRRNSPLSFVKETVDLALKYQGKGVVGLDISGDSTLGDLQQILPELLRFKESKLKLSLHIGESDKEQDQYEILSTLKPDRIGHGVFLEEKAKQWILDHKVPIEVCLTSGHIVEMIEEIKDHPGFLFYQMGHPIILCSDDPLIFSTDLSKEYEKALLHSILSEEDLLEIAKNSHKYAF